MHNLDLEDQLNYKDIPVLKDAQNYVEDLMKDSSKKLSLTIVSNATYSGYFLNGRVYPGKYVKAGTPTWTDAEHGGVSPYSAPVLKNHKKDTDPIGRVVYAEYRHLLNGDAWENDWRNPATGLDKGSGLIRITASISDQEEIQKFLDGRHKTLSTTSVTKMLTCSVCGTNIMKDGFCGHQPGEFYEPTSDSPLAGAEKVMGYFITGPKTYKEVSVVTDPAQPHAVVDTVKLISDSIQSKKNLDSLLYACSFDVAGTNLDLIIRDDATGNFVPLTRKPDQPDAIPNGSMKSKIQVAIPETKVLDTKPNDEASKEGVATDKVQTPNKETNMSQETKPEVKPDAKDGKNIEALVGQLADLRDNNRQLQADRDAKDAELTKVLADNTSLKTELHKANCLRLACLRAVTVKTIDGKTLDSADAVRAYAVTLEGRAHNSITDSLKDEDSVFSAKLPHIKGLPNFIKDEEAPEPEQIVREVKPVVPSTDSTKTPDIDI
jgi:hypothetical protein